MKNIKIQLLAILGLSLFSACGDFLEDDISKDTVTLKAPADGVAVSQTTLDFWWEKLEGATSYRIQVVSPSFDSIATLVIDEEITDDTKFEATLPTGTYQWTVIGKNFGYETKEGMVFDLTVTTDSASSLDGSILVLTAPVQDAATNEVDIVFSWQSMLNADDYNFQLASPDFSNNSFILANELLEGTTVSKTLTEGEYLWRVRGQNSSSISPFTERRLTIDLTPPNAPTLTSPADGATVTMPVVLNWIPDLDSERDTLYVYKDSLATISVLKAAMTNSQFSFNDSSANKYFWRLRTVDKAGNIGPYSSLRKFLVQ